MATEHQNSPPGGFARAALVVAHPVHIFKLYGWMLQHKPVVYILTNSAADNSPRPLPIEAFVAEIERCGATRGEIFDSVCDADVYRAVLQGDAAFFIAMAEKIAASFVRNRIDFVVADAEEGYAPAHDLCRAVTDAAVRIAAREQGSAIANFACRQTEWLAGPRPHDDSCQHLELDDATFARKLATAEHYPEWGGVIAEAIAKLGRDSFRTECLRPILDCAPPDYAAKPYYETSGEQQVASGRFETVIRYNKHIRPIWNAIRAHAAVERA